MVVCPCSSPRLILVLRRIRTTPPDPLIAVHPNERALQHLLSHAVPQDELPSLIGAIFSDSQATDAIDSLRGSDARTFIDVIDEVRHHT